MPIVLQKFITRSDLRSNRDKKYVFGDNVRRTGYAGQAKEMRGEPNAIGIVTKWAPSMDPKAFFDDTEECMELVERDLLLVQQALDRGRTVVVPTDGIGTGFSRLPQVAPHLDRFIKEWFASRQERIGLGRCPKCGEPGRMMEKRPNGFTYCINNHMFKSSEFR